MGTYLKELNSGAWLYYQEPVENYAEAGEEILILETTVLRNTSGLLLSQLIGEIGRLGNEIIEGKVELLPEFTDMFIGLVGFMRMEKR